MDVNLIDVELASHVHVFVGEGKQHLFLLVIEKIVEIRRTQPRGAHTATRTTSTCAMFR